MGWAIGIMIVAGLVGGIVNLALNETSRREWYWTITAGIGAALLIPLFLKTLSSQLLANVVKGTPEGTLYEDCLVFFGFCLLAALSSRAFIQGLSDKVVSSLKERQNELEGKIDQTDRLTKEIVAKSEETDLIAETAYRSAVGQKGVRSHVRSETAQREIAKGDVPDDPWKGVFGGKNEANGRRLEAKITPMASKQGWCSLTLRVLSDDPGRPLSGTVTFFLHPTFKNEQLVVKVDETRQLAELTLAAWGAFTVGALADNGETRLELDLASEPQAPKWFREA